MSDRVRIEVPGEFPQLTLAAWVRIEGVNNWLSSLMLTDDGNRVKLTGKSRSKVRLSWA